MSHSQFRCITLILRHAWLSLWDKHMTTGRINQVPIVRFPLRVQGYLHTRYTHPGKTTLSPQGSLLFPGGKPLATPGYILIKVIRLCSTRQSTRKHSPYINDVLAIILGTESTRNAHTQYIWTYIQGGFGNQALECRQYTGNFLKACAEVQTRMCFCI